MRFHFTQTYVPKIQRKHRVSALFRGTSMVLIFASAGVMSFFLGLQSVRNVNPMESTVAQTAQGTIVNVILQYQPVTGGQAVKPIEVTPFMNGSQSALAYLQEIHNGRIVPASTNDRCRTSNSLGRCSVQNVPVGPDAASGLAGVDQQYDILVDTVFIEFLTGVALEDTNAHVRFYPAKCGGGTTSFTSGGGWCLTKANNQFAREYFVTITLQERDDCTDSSPPAAFCDVSGKLVSFACNPSYAGATRPWEPKPRGCETVQCPDGNFTGGVCSDITTEFSACSTAEACRNHLLCSVTNFGSTVSYDAGIDTIVIRGERFGMAGGTVSFVTATGRETVEVFPGIDWTDTQIRVRVPRAAITGELRIHPHTHGFTEDANGGLIPVECASPSASIRAFKDQFAILSLHGKGPQGTRLVAPGFSTELQALVRHNEKISRLKTILVELFNGAFANPDNLPLDRTLIAQATCPVTASAGGNVQEALLLCTIPVPASASVYSGPYTFLVTVIDDQGNTEKASLIAGGNSALAGDFDLNGVLGIPDAAIARRLAGGTMPVLEQHRLRDTDGDRNITMNDVLFVLHSLTQ